MIAKSGKTDIMLGSLFCLAYAALTATLICLPAGCKKTTSSTPGEPDASSVPVDAPQETVSVDAAAFFLYLKMDSTEHSKDRNSEITEIRIIDKNVDYSWRYEGFPPGANKKTQKRCILSQPDFDRLTSLIEDKKLNRSVSEDKPTAIGRALDLSLEIKLKDQKTKTRIAGMTSIWGQDGKSNIENSDYCDGARELVDFIKSKLNL